MRRALLFIIASSALLGCSDRLTQPTRTPSAASLDVAAERADTIEPIGPIRTWWRVQNQQLLVFSTLPEIGMNSAYGWGAIQRMEDEGHVRVVRTTLYWDNVKDPGSGTYNFPAHGSGETAIIDQLADDHPYMEALVVVVNHGPDEQNPVGVDIGNASASEANFDNFNHRLARFVAAAARRYPRARYWQIWNEEDTGWWGQPWGYPTTVTSTSYIWPRFQQGERYAETLQEVHDSLLAVNPNAVILIGGLTGQEKMAKDASGNWGVDYESTVTWDFLKGVLAADGGQYFDVLATHIYGANPYSGPRNLQDQGQSLRTALNSYEAPGRPIWITEFGMDPAVLKDSVASPDYDQAQANYYSAVFANLTGGGQYDKALGYTLRTTEGGSVYPTDEERYSLGLLYCPSGCADNNAWAWSPRPAWGTVGDDNGAQREQTYSRGDVTVYLGSSHSLVPTREDGTPYSYTWSGDYMTIHDVILNRAFPTRIQFASDSPSPPDSCGFQWIC